MTTNKPEVKRYDCTSGGAQYCYGCYTMKEDEMGDYVEWEAYESLQADYQRLQAECEELRKDAERYRWLRDDNDNDTSGLYAVRIDYWSDEYRGQAACEIIGGDYLDRDIDAAIDAAMEKQK